MIKHITKSIVFSVFLIILALVTGTEASAQTLKMTTGITYGEDGADEFHSVIPTSDGGYIAIGSMNSDSITIVDSNNESSSIVNNGMTDALIVKFDKDNNIEWHKNYGASLYESFDSIIETEDGYIVIGETTSDGISVTDKDGLQSAIVNKGATDAIIVKYDKDGNIIWHNNYGSYGVDCFMDVILSSDGSYVAVGTMSQSGITINDSTGTSSTLISNGDSDAVIVKYDQDGNIIWHKNYGGSGSDGFNSIIETKDGYVALGSIFSSTISYVIDGKEEEVISNGEYDAVIVKYDQDGNIEWHKNYGGSSLDYLRDIVLASDGGYVLVGYTTSQTISATINNEINEITNNGEYDSVIVKYDQDGNVEWHKNYGDVGEELFNSIVRTSNNKYIVGGRSGSIHIVIDALNDESYEIVNKGEYDAIIVVYDENGNVEYHDNYGGEKTDTFMSVIELNNGEILAVGKTSSEELVKADDLRVNAIIVRYMPIYSITTRVNGSNGKISTDSNSVELGKNNVITFVPNPHYTIDKVLLNGKDVTSSVVDNQLTLKSVNDDCLVEVSYKIITYSITTNVNGYNGTISPGSLNVESGTNYIVTFKPYIHYMIDKVIVNGQDMTLKVVNNKLTLENVDSDYLVTVSYKRIMFSIVTSVTGGNGTISPSTKVASGTDYVVTFDPDEKYMIDNIKVNNSDWTSKVKNDKLIIEDVDRNYNVVVAYKLIKYKITTSVNGENGTISDGDMIVVGDDFEVTFTPNKGYMIDTVIVNEVDLTDKVVDNKLILENVIEDTSVVVTYKLAPRNDAMIAYITLGIITLGVVLGATVYSKKNSDIN